MQLMERQFAHAQMPQMNADELARQDFVQSYKLHLATKIAPALKTIYDGRLKPGFETRNGRSPADRTEVADLMEEHPFYRMWGALARTGQELCWNSVAEPVARQSRALAERATQAHGAGGSLELNADLPMPKYLSAVDIHCMPGSYGQERFPGDVSQGAIYDRGVHIYGMGGAGPKTDGAGRLTSAYLKARFPDLQPRRILDIGCGVGHALLPYADAFPQAELHGVDVAGPLVRYGHARAEALGVKAHFKQMNAEALAYPDEHFDLVVSHIVLHETSNAAVRRIISESRRVAAKGGVVAHLDMCFYEELEPFDGFMLMWDTHNNNEPFWDSFRKMDAKTLFTGAGFDPDKLFNTKISRAYGQQAVFSEGKHDAGRGTWSLMGAVR